MTTTSLLATSLMSPARDALVGAEAGAVQQIERLALGQLLVGVDEADAAGDTAALQVRMPSCYRPNRRRR